MQALVQDQNIDGSIITFLADPTTEFTDQLKMKITDPGPESLGIIGRCIIFSMYAVKGTILDVVVSKGHGDPAGDGNPSKTLAKAVIKRIQSLEST